MDAGTMDARKAAAQARQRIKRLLINKQWHRAVDLCTEALVLQPGCYKVLRLRALAHAALKDHESALRDANAVLSKVPSNGDAWYQKGYSHYHLKQFPEAGLAFNPSDRMLQQGYWDALNLMSQSRADIGAHAALQAMQSSTGTLPSIGTELSVLTPAS